MSAWERLRRLWTSTAIGLRTWRRITRSRTLRLPQISVPARLPMKTSSEDSPASKPSSTTDADPSDAPIAIESPHAFRGSPDMRGSRGSGAYIHVGAGGWLIALTVVASVSLTALILMMAYGPSYIDAKVQAGIAEANATARLARAEASVALDKVGDLRDELNRKGADIPALDGH